MTNKPILVALLYDYKKECNVLVLCKSCGKTPDVIIHFRIYERKYVKTNKSSNLKLRRVVPLGSLCESCAEKILSFSLDQCNLTPNQKKVLQK